MRVFRIFAGVLVLLLAVGMAGEAMAAYMPTNPNSAKIIDRSEKMENGVSVPYHAAGERACRHWWGVLYGDALLLARAEEEEIPPEEETEVVFVWPLWEWLLRVLGFR